MIQPRDHPSDSAVPAETVRLACRAMASRFELVLHGDDPSYLRAAGEAALAEIERLEDRLSRFRATSDIGRVNARASREPVRVEAATFALLQTCRQIHQQTRGAFDVTVGTLMQAWGFVHNTGSLPRADVLEEARSRTGMHLVELDEPTRSVRFVRPGVAIDLGAIGKGYAVDEAMLILREAGVDSAFLHGGTSTIAAIGSPPDEEAWHVAIPHPRRSDASDDILRVVALRDGALSVSAVWGREFVAQDVSYGHVLDPRVGRPVDAALLAAVELPSATTADALSTALLVMGDDGRSLMEYYPDLRSLIMTRDTGADEEPSADIRRLDRGVIVRKMKRIEGAGDGT